MIGVIFYIFIMCFVFRIIHFNIERLFYVINSISYLVESDNISVPKCYIQSVPYVGT